MIAPVDCLYCGASAGVQCTRPDGRPGPVHTTRVADAEVFVRRARFLVARLGGELVRVEPDGSFVVRLEPEPRVALVAVDIPSCTRTYAACAA